MLNYQFDVQCNTGAVMNIKYHDFIKVLNSLKGVNIIYGQKLKKTFAFFYTVPFGISYAELCLVTF